MNPILVAKNIISKSLFIPVEKIPDNGSLNDIQPMDSLSFEGLVIGIEQAVGHEVDIMELLELRSVEDVVNVLKRNGL
ncbi:acyl carrier protein [Snodgrassella sp. CFCC 13594]|uniref:acyl carrier protein n=1 Tax=Snodgrassella sp. CFCC 13594 TaxID=1775559 RepID=UPI000A4FB2A6|nr:acyl carrier protein [Snodgrassella sp. CFCC 13594]